MDISSIFHQFLIPGASSDTPDEHTGLRFYHMVKMANLIDLVLVSPLNVSNCRPKLDFITRFPTPSPFVHFLDHNPVFEGVSS